MCYGRRTGLYVVSCAADPAALQTSLSVKIYQHNSVKKLIICVQLTIVTYTCLSRLLIYVVLLAETYEGSIKDNNLNVVHTGYSAEFLPLFLSLCIIIYCSNILLRFQP